MTKFWIGLAILTIFWTAIVVLALRHTPAMP